MSVEGSRQGNGGGKSPRRADTSTLGDRKEATGRLQHPLPAAPSSRLQRFRTIVEWIRTATLRNTLIVASGLLFFLAIASYLSWDRPPRDIRIATNQESTGYYIVGDELREKLEAYAGRYRTVENCPTHGTGDNVQRLEDSEAEFAIVQDGAFDTASNITYVAPLFPEFVHVLVKKEIKDELLSANGLPGGDITRAVLSSGRYTLFCGDESSGMKESAEDILEHYGCALQAQNRVADAEDPDVVISTTNRASKRLEDRLANGAYVFLEIEAEAIADRYPYFTVAQIPKGAFKTDVTGRPVPDRPIATVKTTAFLITRPDVSYTAVTWAMQALYAEGLADSHADLVSFDDAKVMSTQKRFHPASRDFYNPFDPGRVATWVEALAGSYELAFALGAGVFFLWTLRRRRRERAQEAAVHSERQRLDVFLEKTMDVEQAQADCEDTEQLTEYLKEVTEIKIEALKELSLEHLRSDQSLSLFLMQCMDLMSKIQLKILASLTRTVSDTEAVDPWSVDEQRPSPDGTT